MKSAKLFFQRYLIQTGIGLITVLMIISSVSSWYNKQEMLRTADLKQKSEAMKRNLDDVFNHHIRRMDVGLRGYALTRQETMLPPYTNGRNDLLLSLDKIDNLLRDGNHPDSTSKHFQQIRTAVEAYAKASETMRHLVETEQMAAFMDLLKEDKGFDLWKVYEPFLTAQTAYENQQIQKADADYNAAMTRNLWAQMLLLIIGFPVLYWLIKQLNAEAQKRKKVLAELKNSNEHYLFNSGSNHSFANPEEIIEASIQNFKQASSFVKSIASGNLDVEWSGLDEKNRNLNKETLAGELLQLRRQMKRTQTEDERRNWTNEGLARFSEMVRNNQNNLEKLANETIGFLTKYLQTQQGSLFVIQGEGDNQYLELSACYAFDRKKFIEKQIPVGAGLVGQAYLEGETILLTEVPQGYTAITSGLGDSTPSCLAIVPMKYNEHIEAIIELAGFEKFEEYKIHFLEKAGEFVASAIRTVKIANQTQELLSSSQIQSQALKEQEEEMRQNMEELSATQEEMHRNTYEMESRIKAIDQSGIASIEFDLKGIIVSANHSFLALMGYQLSDVVGRHHSMFVKKEHRDSQQYKDFWTNLARGIAQPGEFERVSNQGDTIYIYGCYSIIRNPDGSPNRVLKIAIDITASKAQLDKLQRQEASMHQYAHEMETRLRAIDQTGIASIEFNLDGTILTANDSFLQLMGYSAEEIIGQHHRIFVEESFAKTQTYANFWAALTKGESQSGEFQRITKHGDRVFIFGCYSAMYDSEGKPERILKLAMDITATKVQIDQMNEQEEEMRQSMEELSATQEELERKERELTERLHKAENRPAED